MRPLVLVLGLVALLASAAPIVGGFPSARATEGTAAELVVAAVDVVDNAYAPPDVTVAVGDVVRWSWVGSNPHSVTAPGVFDSHPDCSLLTQAQCGGNGATYEWRPEQVGDVEYSCRIHGAQMRGIVRVVAADDGDPEPSPAEEPSPSEEPAASEQPEPSEEPSPEPSEEPSPEPSQAPSPEPSPPSPTPTSPGGEPQASDGETTDEQASAPVFGPPSPAPTAPLPTIGSTASEPAVASSPSEPELEPFPSPAAPGEEASPGIVTVPQPGDGGPLGRTAALVLGGGALDVTLGAFGRFVLFGPIWR